MAEPQAGSSLDLADIEEARNVDEPPSGTSRDAKVETENLKNVVNGFEASRTVEVEKVIVLSFRTLQLQRIAELQDDLLHLTFTSAVKESSQRPDKKEVDKALRDYGGFARSSSDLVADLVLQLRPYATMRLSLHAQPDIPPGARLVGIMAMKLQEVNPERLRSVAGGIRSRLAQLIFIYIGILSQLVAFNNNLGNPTHGAFILGVIRSMFGEITDDIPTKNALHIMEKAFGNLGFRELDQKGREETSQKNALTQRIIMALFGGIALIGPMIIMTLHQSRNTSLITASLATFVFALVMAFAARDSAGKDVLGITAAYAAVLVVFVGTSTTPST